MALAGILTVLAVLVYWQLVLAEGVYLGPRFVCRLYDWTARRYESIKRFDPYYERRFLGEPLSLALSHYANPTVLDVASGTGRLARTLLDVGQFRGRLVGLDRARRMLLQGRRLLGDANGVHLVQGDAMSLPFPDSAFEAVACLEALEFFPDMAVALDEMVRVLKPGGVLLITNRKGGARYYMPGHCVPTPEMVRLLESLGLDRVGSSLWQVNYDLAFGRKGRGAGTRRGQRGGDLQ